MAGRDFSAIDAVIISTDPEDVAHERLYGAWQAYDVDQARAALTSYDEPWWVCGGHAIEAFTRVTRHHEDVDVGFFTRDLAALRDALGDAYDVWSVGDRTLRPVTREVPELHPNSEQVWVREHAWAPWRIDLLATPDDDGRWVNKRELSMVLPLDEATWVADDGVRYLNPELVLVMKAKLARPKDDLDLDAALPLLAVPAKELLRAYVARKHPDHAWLARLSD